MHNKYELFKTNRAEAGKIRKLKGFSQEYMLNRLKISQNSYSKIERGEMEITVKNLNEICNVVEIDMNALKRFDPFKK